MGVAAQTGDIVVYTCITGGYDRLARQPSFDGLSYVCFSSDPVQRSTRGWDVRPLVSPPGLADPRLINRFHKMQVWQDLSSHPLSIYIDGNVRLSRAFPAALSAFWKAAATFGAFSHEFRTTVAEELDMCIRRGKLAPDEVAGAREMVMRHQGDGFADDRGLTENYLLIRDSRSEPVRRAMDLWWRIVSGECPRDQLSLPYVLWKSGVDAVRLERFASRAGLVTRVRHEGSRRSVLGRVGAVVRHLGRH